MALQWLSRDSIILAGSGIIANKKLAEKVGFQSYETFKSAYKEWIDEALENDSHTRQSEWSESIAVGSKKFTFGIKEMLGIRAKGRTPMKSNGGGYQLRESMPYHDNIDNHRYCQENIGIQNGYFWESFKNVMG